MGLILLMSKSYLVYGSLSVGTRLIQLEFDLLGDVNICGVYKCVILTVIHLSYLFSTLIQIFSLQYKTLVILTIIHLSKGSKP